MQSYSEELHLLRDQLLGMAGQAETMLAQAVKSFVQQDAELAKSTIELDDEINRVEMEIDELCVTIMMRRQPVAGDLRFIATALKMTTDLERIGDLAVDVAQRTIRLGNAQAISSAYDTIGEMGVLVQGMIASAMQAFVDKDVTRANALLLEDDVVDEMYHQMRVELLEMMKTDLSVVERGYHIQSVAKFVERIGDHATNLAEQVIFMVAGKDVRHGAFLREKYKRHPDNTRE